MSLLITIVGVGLGVAYTGLMDRRLSVRGWQSWLLTVPVLIAYAVVLFTADTREPGPRAIQAFCIGALIQTAVGGWRADRDRRSGGRRRRPARVCRASPHARWWSRSSDGARGPARASRT